MLFDVSLTAAFVGGLLSFLAPCGALVLPNFFVYTFKERSRLVRATFLFWLGFISVFIPFSLGVSLVVQTLIIHRATLVWLAGLLLILFGVLSFFGKGLHTAIPQLGKNRQHKNDSFGVYLLGITYSFLLAGCSAPILGSIVTLASLAPSKLHGLLLLLVYSLGLLLPFFILALVADRSNFANSKFVRGTTFSWQLFGQSFSIHSTNLISAGLFVLVGGLMIITNGHFFTDQWRDGSLFDWYLNTNEWLLNTTGLTDVFVVIGVIILFGGIWALRRRQRSQQSTLKDQSQ